MALSIDENGVLKGSIERVIEDQDMLIIALAKPVASPVVNVFQNSSAGLFGNSLHISGTVSGVNMNGNKVTWSSTETSAELTSQGLDISIPTDKEITINGKRFSVSELMNSTTYSIDVLPGTIRHI